MENSLTFQSINFIKPIIAPYDALLWFGSRLTNIRLSRDKHPGLFHSIIPGGKVNELVCSWKEDGLIMEIRLNIWE